ncbi:MAG: Grx4 family monothiol glutaredoxin [Gammaproteobacteria bacterium]|nr:Grx4 family monothiol glutaredoxin [Gammaproteobacteria bacterium]MBU6509433.1 Grx4 family monothiol glutaredoxin [Gammaproteobacteria bacterium]MDE1983709.1 Grx4 family monothiol glutaredoxin [Gammaproteobacteria bacterium]MDE2107909.1 Grx4 family monothiol glutaredoxin [Gammaproteobacteria bacterium]MDE2460209.1 Grx4 family monothiol glutaredoxin [Gammaproteobacteria bacterium]
MDAMARIKDQVQSQQVLLYMKGTPDFPQCGFSMRTVQVLKNLAVDFGHVNVLADPEIRANLPKYSNWPTFPQLFVKGELVGGCDITVEMYESGELQKLFDEKGIKHG